MRKAILLCALVALLCLLLIVEAKDVNTASHSESTTLLVHGARSSHRHDQKVRHHALTAARAQQPTGTSPPPTTTVPPVTLNIKPFSSLPQSDQDAFNTLCKYCTDFGSKQKPTIDPSLSVARKRILQTAEQYVNAVSDCGGMSGKKFGAENLVQIYRDGLQRGFSEADIPNITKAYNKGWKSGPWSWCGIWSVAAIRAAGITDVSWGIGKLVGRPVTYGSKGVQPGDIAIWTGKLNHHDIVEAIEGQVVYTIDGNQECSGIMRKKRNLKDMAGYYKIVTAP